MLIEESYKKDIRRTIDPVVKANATDHLANELEEFVITAEVKEHLHRFYDEYNDLDSAGNGAWISGFFGSGKSHLLKMLAVLLENEVVEGKPALDYVLPKVDDASLRAQMQRATELHPSQSILFNIDSLAPNTGKASAGPLLAAFIKAFNLRRGYFGGDQLYIAQLEADLDQQGHLEDFRQEVERLTHRSWDQVRKTPRPFATKVSQAFDAVCGNAPGTNTNVIARYQDDYRPSIASFAEQVNDYIESQQVACPGFRLNFFVDEVGQFIAKDTNRMTNLQTVAEEFNTRCHGNAWIVVTSQENMDDVVGEMESKSGNDFTKIQSRLLVRMPLTSQDAKEVIQERLLAKKPEDEPEFEDLYDRYKGDFPVLFDFADGSKDYATYRSQEEFVTTYPFVPYQFDLFMASMRGLSAHNAFTGKYDSTGARSMLSIFQDVALKLCDSHATTEEGALAAFDMMFDGMRNMMRGEVYAAVSTAQDNLTDQFQVRVLEALLLVKYVEEFRATPANLRVLLYGGFKQNAAQLDARIKAALDELERQSYIRRNGNTYEYLTNEEQDIEKEIKNTPVYEPDVNATIDQLFRDIVGNTKVTYRNGAFQHSFSYGFGVGEGPVSGHADLTVRLRMVDAGQRLGLEVEPTGPKTLSITLQNAGEFMEGVRTFKQTETYVNQKTGSEEHLNAILSDKRKANGKLRQRLKDMLAELLGKARYNVAGVDVPDAVTGKGKDAVESAAQELVRRSYPGLQQLDRNFKDETIAQQCSEPQMHLPEYANTVLARIGQLHGSPLSVTVAGPGEGSLTYYFGRNDYGWPESAVRSAVAVLFGSGKVEVRKAGHELGTHELAQALQKSTDLDKLVVAKVMDVTPQQLSVVRDAYRRVTGQSATATDVKQIADELELYARQTVNQMVSVQPAVAAYPFSGEFASRLKQLQELLQHAGSADWVVNALPQKSAEYADAITALNAMSGFAKGNGGQKRWLEMRDFVNVELPKYAGLQLDGQKLDQIRSVLADPKLYASAGSIPHAYQALKAVRADAAQAMDALRADARDGLASYRRSYQNMDGYAAMGDDKRAKFDAIFDSAETGLASEDTYYRLKGYLQAFKDKYAAVLLNLVTPKPEPPQPKPPVGPVNPPEEPPTPPVRPVTVRARDLHAVGYHKPAITTSEELDAYLAGLGEAMQAELDQNHVISL